MQELELVRPLAAHKLLYEAMMGTADNEKLWNQSRSIILCRK